MSLIPYILEQGLRQLPVPEEAFRQFQTASQRRLDAHLSFLAYFKYSRGYKSGGWSTYTLGPQPYVGSEFVRRVRAGRQETIGRTWTLNGDVFYYNYNNEQVPLSLVNTNTNQIIPILYNVPLAHNYGVELWGTWRPIDPLAISLARISYLSAKVADIRPASRIRSTHRRSSPAPTSGAAPRQRRQYKTNGTLLQNIVGQTIPGATPNKIRSTACTPSPSTPGS